MLARVARSLLCAPPLLLSGAWSADAQSLASTSSASVPGRVVEVRAAEFFFQAPDTIPAGLTTFRLLQTGLVVDRIRSGAQGRDRVADKGDPTRGLHMLWVVRLDSGKTVTDLYRAAASGARMSSWARQLGGPAFVFPPSTTNATIDLEPGNYALVCYVGSAHADRSRSHLLNGMFRSLTVTAALQRRPASAKVDVVATISGDKAVTFSQPLRAGRVVVRVENETDEDLEFKFQRVPVGQTGAEFLATRGAGPGTSAGGLSSVPTRASVVTTLDLTSGEYIVGTHMSIRHATSQVVTVVPRAPE